MITDPEIVTRFERGLPCLFTLILDLTRETVIDHSSLKDMTKHQIAGHYGLNKVANMGFEELAGMPYLPFCAASYRMMRRAENNGHVPCPCLDTQHETWNFGGISSKICHYYGIPQDKLLDFLNHRK